MSARLPAQRADTGDRLIQKRCFDTLFGRGIFTKKYFLIACFRDHAVEHLRVTNSPLLGRTLHAKV
ncbi:hypothetical protein, partial [Halorubrum sp. SS7]|uniref:hypothetical protein n=1 Tax=Halorubrum sp. SS7 TaxID=2518119 RepID=UPI001A7E0E72